MAVYTQITLEELNLFLESNDLGKAVSFEPIAEGVENTNYLLRNENSQYILTIFEKRVKEEDMPFFLGLMRHLAERKIPCPVPLTFKEGKLYSYLKGKPATIVSFLQGAWPREIVETHCSYVAKNMAKMHLAAKDFTLTRKNDLSLDGWKDLFRKIGQKANHLHHDMTQVISQELIYLEANWPKNLPQGIIHADLFPDNVFFVEHHLSGILDFYFACNDMLAYDLAIAINAWCFETSGELNMGKAKSMISKYHKVRHLSKDELTSMPILLRGAALRFLLSRLYDLIYHPEGAFVVPKDPMEYYEKLLFQQKVSGL